MGTHQSFAGRRGAGARDLALFRASLAGVFVEGGVCLFEAIEEFGRRLEEAEEDRRKMDEERRVMDAKIQRLRKQKKLWFDRMMRAVSRGIADLEELDRIEAEEAAKEAARQAEGRPSSAEGYLSPGFIDVWDASRGDVPLDPSVLSMIGSGWENPDFSVMPASPGSGGGTAEVSAGSSQGAS